MLSNKEILNTILKMARVGKMLKSITRIYPKATPFAVGSCGPIILPENFSSATILKRCWCISQ